MLSRPHGPVRERVTSEHLLGLKQSKSRLFSARASGLNPLGNINIDHPANAGALGKGCWDDGMMTMLNMFR